MEENLLPDFELRRLLGERDRMLQRKNLRPVERLNLSRLNTIIEEQQHMRQRMGGITDMKHVSELRKRESSETASQRERLRKGVERAKKLGVIREEIYAAALTTDRVCYLLSSSHFNPDPTGHTREEHRQSQTELVHLMQLLIAEGVDVPLFLEANLRSKSQFGFTPPRPWIPAQGIHRRIFEPEAQQAIFADNQLLKSIMEDHRMLAAEKQYSSPKFYYYVPYPTLRGSESHETHAASKDYQRLFLQRLREIDEKYKPLRRSLFEVSKTAGQLQILTGWDSGTEAPLLQLAEKWIPAEEVLSDMKEYISILDTFDRFTAKMESDMAECVQSEQGPVLAYMGKAHEFKIVDLLRPFCEMRALTPVSSIVFDNVRTPLTHSHRDNSVYWVKTAESLRDIAIQHIGAPQTS